MGHRLVEPDVVRVVERRGWPARELSALPGRVLPVPAGMDPAGGGRRRGNGDGACRRDPPRRVPLGDNPGGVDWRFGGVSGRGEYFLVENRQQVGYDAGLPGCGLLVWHVDEWTTPSNLANANEDRGLVDLETADGSSALGDPGDPFPGWVPGEDSPRIVFDDRSVPGQPAVQRPSIRCVDGRAEHGVRARP